MVHDDGSPRPRILLRGIGSISALGTGSKSVGIAYAESRGGLTSRDFGGERLPCGALPPEAEVALHDFFATRPRMRGLDRSVKLAVYAARQAVEAAWGGRVPERLGVAVGSSRGATELLEASIERYLRAPDSLPPSTSPATTLGNLSSWVAQELSPLALAAPELSSTCSTSLSAVAIAAAFLRAGMADCFVAGGAEAPLTPFTLAQMRALGVHSCSLEAWPCRPCALEPREKNCMVLGEGSALLALEAVPSGVAATTGVAWLSGVGLAVEPITSKTSIHRDGLGLRLSMERALEDAGGPAPDVVITHTPGTEQGDRAELEALKSVFGTNVPHLTCNKWLLGHTLGASGTLSVEYAALLLGSGRPAVTPYRTLCETPAPGSIGRVLVNSIGFGGSAASVILDSCA